MNIWKISIKNIKSKPLYTFLSVFVLSLSITLLLGIQQLKFSFKHQMETNLSGIDLVIGAKGSPLQLVLASVLHLDNPTGNISYEDAQEISKTSMIKSAIPISYGDNYKNFRIIGTTQDFSTLYNAELQKGRIVKNVMEVILGNTVAEKLHLTIGDTFLSSHGLVENNIEVHATPFKIVGILKPTLKIIDRLIITNLESIWNVHHHESDTNHEEKKPHDTKEYHHEKSEEEITSLLITFKNPAGFLTLPRKINKQTNMQAALPKYELDKLYEYTGAGFKTISWIAYLILLISGITIFTSLYKMVKDRAFDLALLRTYGASNFQLAKIVIYESLIVVLFAYILGFILVKIGFYFVLKIIEPNYQQIVLQKTPFQEVLHTGAFVLSIVIISSLLAIYPIIKMHISTILSNEK